MLIVSFSGRGGYRRRDRLGCVASRTRQPRGSVRVACGSGDACPRRSYGCDNHEGLVLVEKWDRLRETAQVVSIYLALLAAFWLATMYMYHPQIT